MASLKNGEGIVEILLQGLLTVTVGKDFSSSKRFGSRVLQDYVNLASVGDVYVI